MNILFDTHVLLWIAFGKKEKFPVHIWTMLTNPSNQFYVSIATVWEIAIKSALKKPNFEVNVDELVAKFDCLGVKVLPISLVHAVQVANLPLIHRDPFDRLLIVQAKYENLKLLTVDEKIVNYQLDCVLDMRQ